MNVTVKDVARKAGVSATTVSLSFQAHSRISASTKSRVLSAARQLGYMPNKIARQLRSARSHLLGLIVPEISNPFHAEIASGVEEVGRKRGYSVTFYNTRWDEQTEREAIQNLLEFKVEGLVIATSEKVNDLLIELSKKDFPMILVDTKIKGANCDYVINDLVGAGFLATYHLLKLGHKNIAHISGPKKESHFSAFNDLIRGWKKALRRMKIRAKPDLIEYGGLRIEDGYRATKEVLSRNPRPTAIFAVNDLAALGAVQYIEEQGLKVPQDIAVVGIDNLDVSGLSRLNVTSIQQPTENIGRIATNILIDRIEGGERNSPKRQHIKLKPRLVVRGSCGSKIKQK